MKSLTTAPKRLAVALALGLSALAAVPHATLAETATPDHAVAATQSANANPNVRISAEGFQTARAIRAARIAIFQGDPAAATKAVDSALQDWARVNKDDLAAGKAGPGNWVPIDGGILVADDYVGTPQKDQHIINGNTKLKEGKTAEAIKELKLAEIDISFSRLLLPLDTTKTHLDTAASLLKEGKYYEANMALKAAEDGMREESVTLVETPKPATPTPATTAAPAHPEPAK